VLHTQTPAVSTELSGHVVGVFGVDPLAWQSPFTLA